jgi:hypothetical protein
MLSRPPVVLGWREVFERYDRRIHARLGDAKTTDLVAVTAAAALVVLVLVVTLIMAFGQLVGSLVGAVLAVGGVWVGVRTWEWWLGPNPRRAARLRAAGRPVHDGFYRSGQQRRMELLGREGVADHREVAIGYGVKRLLDNAAVLRPALAERGERIRPLDVGFCLGRSRGRDVFMSIEHPELIVGPPRSGKGMGLVINEIIAAPGPVIASSVRSDNMQLTIKARALVGPVAVFDPEGVSGRESTFFWSPLAGCEDARVAQRRAQVLVKGTGISRGENMVWGSTAGGILQALLHAAALGGRSIHELYRWAQSPAHMSEAARILENLSSEDWGPQLETIKSADPRLQGSQFLGVKEAMRPLDLEQVREAFNVPAEQVTDIGQFLAASGTLYPIAPWSGEDADTTSTGRYVTLLFDEFIAEARHMSQAGNGKRLDPPLVIVADELANMHPWANLAQSFAAGSGEGVKVVAVFQSLAQLRSAYTTHIADTLWNAANLIILGGNKNPSDLDAISRLLADRTVKQTQESWSETAALFALRRGGHEQISYRPVLTSDDLRRIPQGCALVVAEAHRPALVDLEAWPERPWASLVAESDQWHRDHEGTYGLTPLLQGRVA